jgi:hypothetical protein
MTFRCQSELNLLWPLGLFINVVVGKRNFFVVWHFHFSDSMCNWIQYCCCDHFRNVSVTVLPEISVAICRKSCMFHQEHSSAVIVNMALPKILSSLLENERSPTLFSVHPESRSLVLWEQIFYWASSWFCHLQCGWLGARQISLMWDGRLEFCRDSGILFSGVTLVSVRYNL